MFEELDLKIGEAITAKAGLITPPHPTHGSCSNFICSETRANICC
jgi:hypothetical protein